MVALSPVLSQMPPAYSSSSPCPLWSTLSLQGQFIPRTGTLLAPRRDLICATVALSGGL